MNLSFKDLTIHEFVFQIHLDLHQLYSKMLFLKLDRWKGHIRSAITEYQIAHPEHIKLKPCCYGKCDGKLDSFDIIRIGGNHIQ